jgi:hypothetical protein
MRAVSRSRAIASRWTAGWRPTRRSMRSRIESLRRGAAS